MTCLSCSHPVLSTVHQTGTALLAEGFWHIFLGLFLKAQHQGCNPTNQITRTAPVLWNLGCDHNTSDESASTYHCREVASLR